MNLAALVGLLAVFSIAMVAAMVEYSKAYWSDHRQSRRRWGWIYAVSWMAIFTVLVNIPDADLGMITLVAGGYLATHFTILRSGLALRDAPAPARRRAPQPPRRPSKPISRFWLFAATVALVAIATLLDDTLAANRDFLVPACIALIAAGFAMFMGGILHLLLQPGRTEISLREMKEQWRDPDVKRFYVITGGVFLMLAAAALLVMVLWSGASVTGSSGVSPVRFAIRANMLIRGRRTRREARGCLRRAPADPPAHEEPEPCPRYRFLAR